MSNENNNDDRGTDRPKGSWAISMVFAAAAMGVFVGCNHLASAAAVDQRAKAESANTQLESAPRVLYLSGWTLKPLSHKPVALPAARGASGVAPNVKPGEFAQSPGKAASNHPLPAPHRRV